MALDRNLQDANPVKGLQPRLVVFTWLAGVAFVILVSRAYTLQVVRGEELTHKGRKNFVQDIRIVHDRGIIFDRDGRILADNRPSLDLQVTPAFLGRVEQASQTLGQLATLLGVADDDLAVLRQAVTSQTGLDRFQPIVFKRDLTADQIEAFESERSVFRLDGAEIVEGRRRFFPNGKSAGHLIGYVKEIDADQLEAERARKNPRDYRLGDLFGRDGIERSYERELRGQDGLEKTVVDAKGRRQQDETIRQLLGEGRRVDPQPGRNVFLTIDSELQARAEAAFNGSAGAIVAVEPPTGRVLVMASIPEFDPNLVSGLLGPEEKSRLDTDPLKPWMNRAISGQYAPGSTFKVVPALTALTERATSPKEKVRCPGYFRMGNMVWRCHKDSGHGLVDLHAAIKLSCDVYFYTMGARVGIDALARVGRLLGLGSQTGIELRNEQPGIMPDEAFHNRVDKATGGYQRGMVVNTAIGQGSVLVTPLQLAMAYATVANGGTLFEPRLVDRIETADFRVVRRFLPRARDAFQEEGPDDPEPAESQDGLPDQERRVIRDQVRGALPAVVERFPAKERIRTGLPPEALDLVRAGLCAVVNEPGGTAYYRRSKNVVMCGKTGTAQVIRLGRDRLKPEEVDYFERDHAWFVAFAPDTNPEIVVAVLNEHSGHGGTHAAPIVLSVIDAYFELKGLRAARAAGPRVDGGAP